MKIAFILILACSYFNGHKTGESVLRDMHQRYAGNWFKSFTFVQTTGHYRNDSLIKTSSWREAILFPDKFRIDFGEKKDSNAVYYLGDSVYNVRKGKMIRRSFNEDNLTFLLGGMYFYSFDTVLAKMNRLGYDTRKSFEGNWNGKAAYVIGASSAEEKSNQLWIDPEKLVLLRFIKYKDGEKEEGIFSGHRRFGNAWSETACDFYVNDRLIQKEKYNDCKANVSIDPRIFDPYHYTDIGF